MQVMVPIHAQKAELQPSSSNGAQAKKEKRGGKVRDLPVQEPFVSSRLLETVPGQQVGGDAVL
jgi:hypothetical protein